MSSKRGVPKFAGAVLVCVGVAVSVVIVVVTLSTMGTMREGAVRAKVNGASMQSQATTIDAPVTNTDTNGGDVSADTGDTGDTSANTDNAPSNTDSTNSTSSSNEQQVVVKSGDTLTDLSRDYGRSVDAIANHNGIRDVNLIYEDSVLVIPESCDGN